MSQDENQPQISTASLFQLQKPEKLETLLKEDRQDDCLSCRLTGASAFIGLGTYSYFSGKHQLQKQEAAIVKSGSRFGMKSRQGGITCIALTFIGMGVWRLAN